MNSESFLDLFCEAFKCAPDDFNETLLWLCIFPQAIFLARLIWRLNREYFRPEFELIEQLKGVRNPEDLRSELNDFHYHHPRKGFLRRTLKVRISGQRLLDLGNRLFSKPD